VKGMRLLSVLAGAVLGLSLVIALRPHWLLRVPNVGFILFAMVGGKVPPVSFTDENSESPL